jgi:hypothetical protein
MEETGLSIKNLRVKVTGCAYVKDIETEFYFHYILADYLDGELKQNPNDGEFVWVTIEEMKNLPNLLAEIHKLLPYIFDGTEKVYSIKAVYEKNILLDFILENKNPKIAMSQDVEKYWKELSAELKKKKKVFFKNI